MQPKQRSSTMTSRRTSIIINRKYQTEMKLKTSIEKYRQVSLLTLSRNDIVQYCQYKSNDGKLNKLDG